MWSNGKPWTIYKYHIISFLLKEKIYMWLGNSFSRLLKQNINTSSWNIFWLNLLKSKVFIGKKPNKPTVLIQKWIQSRKKKNLQLNHWNVSNSNSLLGTEKAAIYINTETLESVCIRLLMQKRLNINSSEYGMEKMGSASGIEEKNLGNCRGMAQKSLSRYP